MPKKTTLAHSPSASPSSTLSLLGRALNSLPFWRNRKISTPPPRHLQHRNLPQNLSFSPKTGRYTAAEEIARGGMGAVYAVFDTDMRRTAAMKVALPAVMRSQSFANHFVEEARITGMLEHPNVVPVHDIGFDDDTGLFFTMKKVDGQPLDEILAQVYDGHRGYREKYDLHHRLLIFRNVCEAVAFAHSRQVIHLDIKPENVMIGSFGEVLLMDWGIAKYFGILDFSQRPGPKSGVMPQARGEIRGTPAYMAPEQAKGDVDAIDPQTDIFQLGACLYHMLTFTPPYLGDTEATIQAAAACRPVPPDKNAPAEQIPEELARIVMKAMAAAKTQRYANVAQLLEDIDSFMSGRVLAGQREFQAGDMLMVSGEEGQEAYLITCGSVDVVRESDDTPVKLTTLGPGDIVGEMALITHQPRSATVLAATDVTVQVITSMHMQTALRKMPPWLGRTINTLAERLERLDAMVHPLIAGNCVYHVLKQADIIMTARKVDTHGEPNQAAIQLPELIREVTRNLALPQTRVEAILQTLCHSNMAAMEENRLHLPDNTQFANFLQYCEARTGYDIPTERHQNGSGLPENHQFDQLYQKFATALSGCENR